MRYLQKFWLPLLSVTLSLWKISQLANTSLSIYVQEFSPILLSCRSFLGLRKESCHEWRIEAESKGRSCQYLYGIRNKVTTEKIKYSKTRFNFLKSIWEITLWNWNISFFYNRLLDLPVHATLTDTNQLVKPRYSPSQWTDEHLWISSLNNICGYITTEQSSFDSHCVAKKDKAFFSFPAQPETPGSES